MNATILEYPSNSRIEVKLRLVPDDAVSMGCLLVRDIHNRVQRKVDLSGYQTGTWLDLTNAVAPLERGSVEAVLVRTMGNGPWSATLHLRATSLDRTSETSDTLHRKHNHIEPSVQFCNTT